jgi:hypothetical protein
MSHNVTILYVKGTGKRKHSCIFNTVGLIGSGSALATCPRQKPTKISSFLSLTVGRPGGSKRPGEGATGSGLTPARVRRGRVRGDGGREL